VGNDRVRKEGFSFPTAYYLRSIVVSVICMYICTVTYGEDASRIDLVTQLVMRDIVIVIVPFLLRTVLRTVLLLQ
jgi:hypothetical protein